MSFAIVERGKPVSGIGIVFRHPPETGEPGVWVAAGMRHGATVEPWNAPSQRVPEKVGVVREGLLRS